MRTAWLGAIAFVAGVGIAGYAVDGWAGATVGAGASLAFVGFLVFVSVGVDRL